MRIVLFFASLLLVSISSFAQSLAPVVVSAGGAEQNAGGYKLSSTLGEIVVTTERAGSQIITQGFQQGPNILLSSIREYTPGIDVKVFPNPASEYLYVNISSQDYYRACKISLIDIFGKIIDVPVSKEVINTGEQIRIDLNNIAKGNYIVRVYDQNDQSIYSDIKIIKIR